MKRGVISYKTDKGFEAGVKDLNKQIRQAAREHQETMQSIQDILGVRPLKEVYGK